MNKAVKELESKKGLQQIPKLLKIFEVEDISDLARKILSLKYQTDFWNPTAEDATQAVNAAFYKCLNHRMKPCPISSLGTHGGDGPSPETNLGKPVAITPHFEVNRLHDFLGQPAPKWCHFLWFFKSRLSFKVLRRNQAQKSSKFGSY